MTPLKDSIRTAFVVAVLLPMIPASAQDSGTAFPERTWSEPSSTVQRDVQGSQWDQSPGQRALREQAQRDFQSRQVYPGAQYNQHNQYNNQYNRERHDEWVQRQQQRRQQEILQGPQLELQRRQGEEPIGQRALREQAQTARENERFRQEAQQRKSGGAAPQKPGSANGYPR
ncbi:MAG: hypothetical protein O9327_12480 [Polaromonas sp.]|nr:hypothetical protein [Polaromonas sp.]